ncbi:MAG: hypothetical protein IKU15_06425 [Clostridia bacterium]|nr:hypothetical protein [Clostridia bacterium]
MFWLKKSRRKKPAISIKKFEAGPARAIRVSFAHDLVYDASKRTVIPKGMTIMDKTLTFKKSAEKR